jgi:hypothetical protein
VLDMSPEEVLETAVKMGAKVDPTEGEHATPGAGWLMSRHAHDNSLFMSEHTGDNGKPMGILTVTPGAYLHQLERDKISGMDKRRRMISCVMFSVAVLKIAEKPNAPDIIAL